MLGIGVFWKEVSTATVVDRAGRLVLIGINIHTYIDTSPVFRYGFVKPDLEAIMPRKSPYTITLTDEEERELLEMSRKYTLPYFLVQRTQMILLAAEGLQNKEIAAQLRTRREVVSQWRKRFFYKRLEGLEDRDRPGRPRAFPPKRDRSGQSFGV